MLNKRLSICVGLCGILILTLTVGAMASGRYPWTGGSLTVAKEIPNLTALAPEKGKSGCVTMTATKGTFGVYTSVSGYVGYKAEVVTAAGVAEPVKWELDGTQVATGPSFEFTNSRGNTYSRAVQRIYSAQTARALTSCTRRQ